MTQKKVNQQGSEVVSIPAAESIALSTFNGGLCQIFELIENAKNPNRYEVLTTLQNEATTLGPYASGKTLMIEANNAEVYYNVGASPTIETGGDSSTLGGYAANEFLRLNVTSTILKNQYLANQTFIRTVNTVGGTVNVFGMDNTDTFLLANASYPTTIRSSGVLIISGLPTYADNAAAITGGLATNSIYKTATGELRIVV